MSHTATIETGNDSRYLPRLTSSLNGCVRWRWTDLEDILATQLRMLDELGNDEIPADDTH